MIAVQVFSPVALVVAEDEVSGANTWQGMNKPAIWLLGHRRTGPLRTVYRRIGIPVVDIYVPGPIAWFSEPHDEIFHRHRSRFRERDFRGDRFVCAQGLVRFRFLP